MSARANENTRRQPGVDTALISDNNADVTPITESVKAALLKGQSIRLIDFPPEERQQVVGAIAALRDALPIRANWCTVRESFLNLLWQWAYALEERRQLHASTRHLFSQAACCIALALVRKLERLT